MSKTISRRVRSGLLAATALSGAAFIATAAQAQDEEEDLTSGDVMIVTGTRIQDPNIVAASPVNTIGQDEIARQFTPNLERVFRDLPLTIPGDGENVNNGTEGAATIDLRGLGPERSLVMIDGKRLVPYNDNGIVDVNTIPLNLIERIDIITGGASAVYGSDAMSGAVNFITRKNFEGIELNSTYSMSEQGDGDTYDVSALLGTNFADDRGNIVVSLNYTDRSGVLLADRPFGVVGVDTSSGAGLDGEVPPAPAECDGPFATGIGGSTTAIPGALDLPGGDAQFRNDGTLGPAPCANHNFNPFNYYQTPQERFGITAVGSYDVNDSIEAYARGTFSGINVRQQVAASGVFGNQFEIPLMNPFLTEQARQYIIDDVNSVLPPGEGGSNPDSTFSLADVGVQDLNENGVFDLADSLITPVRRRTLEIGTRSEDYDNNLFQFVVGIRGALNWLSPEWDYDLSFQHAETDRTTTRAGYTNVSNIAVALNTVDATTCTTPDGQTTAGCVPIDLFGPLGSITDEAAQYSQAIAFQTQRAVQTVIHGSVSGPVSNMKTPWAETPLNLALGFEHREESGALEPDECLKLPPVSCQGGAGGNILPVSASYGTWEGFIEGIMPVIENRPFFESLSIEAGFRYSDYTPTDDTTAWKAGVNWQVTPSFRLRYMEQKAVRAPNVSEIGSPITTGLDNANFDPCSSGNPNPITAQLETLCQLTGVPAGQTGNLSDIVAGQVNLFTGTNPAALPGPETARTRTAGFVWQPDVPVESVLRTTLSADYYDIEIEDYIDTLSGDEVFNLCYNVGDEATCAGIVRDGLGRLTTAGTGLPAFFQNLEYFRASGIEVGLNSSFDIGDAGVVSLAFNANYYLKNEYQSSAVSAVVDCKGRYSNSCDPVPQWRSVTRLSWETGPIDASILWRRIGGMEFQGDASASADVFDEFESIDPHNYFDLSVGYQLADNVRLGGLVRNLADKSPPIVGNDIGSTSFNSGNTFPSLYDVLGRTYSLSIKANF